MAGSREEGGRRGGGGGGGGDQCRKEASRAEAGGEHMICITDDI